MMKFGFTLAVLLHFCSGLKPDSTVNQEIIQRLSELGKLHRKHKVNFTSETIRVRSPDMNLNTSACLGVVTRELKSLLNNMTRDENSKDILVELEANLKFLKPLPENDDTCGMRSNSLNPFNQYANFFRKLYRRKR